MSEDKNRFFVQHSYMIDNKLIESENDLIGRRVINKAKEENVINKVHKQEENYVIVYFEKYKNEKKFALEEKYFTNIKLLEKKQEKILNIINRRDIQRLVHFTNTRNLNSILRRGLLTRDNIQEDESSIKNDLLRFDKTNAICVSVTFPNYKMFYSLRANNPDNDYALIIIKPDILTDLRCGFFYTNAANSCFGNRLLSEYQTVESLNRMFAENLELDKHYGDQVYRRATNIPDNYTTDPQAEVLVFENIPLEYIVGVVFNKKSLVDKYIDYSNSIQMVVHEALFKPRIDHKMWHKGEKDG